MKNKILKMLLALLLATALSTVCLVGCGKTDSPPDTGTTGGDPSEGTPSEGEKPPEGTGQGGEENNDPEWMEDGMLKVLAIGNSLSDDMMEHMWRISKSLGVEGSFGTMFLTFGNMTKALDTTKHNSPVWEYRTANARSNGVYTTRYETTLDYAVGADSWDFITFQPGTSESGQEEAFTALQPLVDHVKSVLPENAKTKLLFYMLPAYPQTSTEAGFAYYNNDQMTMYETIVVTTKKCAVPIKDFIGIVPVGTAIQNARTSFLGDTLNRDVVHLTLGTGRYIAGLTLFAYLTGMEIDNIQYAPADVTKSIKPVVIESVKNALAKPYEVTNSQYTEKP